VAQLDASFRDVGARLAALRDGSPDVTGSPPPEEDFESFEDVLLEEDDLDEVDPEAQAMRGPDVQGEECSEPGVHDASVDEEATPETLPAQLPLAESALDGTPGANADAQPDPPLEPAAPVHPHRPEPPPRRRKKKISFV